MFEADRELLQRIFQTFLFSQLGPIDYSECAVKIALVTWSALSAGVQGSLALFFQSLYCTVLNKNSMMYFQLSISKCTKQIPLFQYRIL